MARRPKQGDEISQADFNALVTKKLPGETFLKQVMKTCQGLGYWVAHIPSYVLNCRYCKRPNYRPVKAGVPDLLIARRNPARFLLREIKGVKEAATPEQEWLIETASEAGVDASIWRPDHDYTKELLIP